MNVLPYFFNLVFNSVLQEKRRADIPFFLEIRIFHTTVFTKKMQNENQGRSFILKSWQFKVNEIDSLTFKRQKPNWRFGICI